MLKTERIKKKVGGKKQEVRVEEIQRRDRMERFVSIYIIIYTFIQ